MIRLPAFVSTEKLESMIASASMHDIARQIPPQRGGWKDVTDYAEVGHLKIQGAKPAYRITALCGENSLAMYELSMINGLSDQSSNHGTQSAELTDEIEYSITRQRRRISTCSEQRGHGSRHVLPPHLIQS